MDRKDNRDYVIQWVVTGVEEGMLHHPDLVALAHKFRDEFARIELDNNSDNTESRPRDPIKILGSN